MNECNLNKNFLFTEGSFYTQGIHLWRKMLPLR